MRPTLEGAEFKAWSERVAAWGADYRASIAKLPVRPNIKRGDTRAQLPASPPNQGEAFEAIFDDFLNIIMPGITHWQHPRFFAYFPANAAPPAVLAELAASALSVQCMLWQTSPAATELEELMVDWLRQAVGIPEGFGGLLQDSASSSTLSAVLTMREKALSFEGNKKGLSALPQLRIYCSEEVHSSVDKAIWIAGIGDENLVRIPTVKSNPLRPMDAKLLEQAIANDRAAGLVPAGLVLAVGATGMGATDSLPELLAIARRENLYSHIDAAWAGVAMICPEYRERFWLGAEEADSIVLNPHKWLGAPNECSLQLLRDTSIQLKTLKIQPEYLKTVSDPTVVNGSELSIQLGRRFRALKLWFLIRFYGIEGLQQTITSHVLWAEELAAEIAKDSRFVVTSQPILSLFTFTLAGESSDERTLDLLEKINLSGEAYLTQTRIDGQLVIRFQAGTFDCKREDVLALLPLMDRLLNA